MPPLRLFVSLSADVITVNPMRAILTRELPVPLAKIRIKGKAASATENDGEREAAHFIFLAVSCIKAATFAFSLGSIGVIKG